MNLCLVSTLAIVLGAAPSNAFLLGLINKVNPSIAKFAQDQENAMLKIHFDIADGSSNSHRLGIDGLLLQLHGEGPSYSHPKLPGADGPNPQLSTGAKELTVLRKGQYVDLAGSQQVDLEHGVWEMIWRRNASAGALICGFDVPKTIQRNDASLPAGRIYVTFPVWTTESLQDLRNRKEAAEVKAIEAMDRQREELQKMQSTNNLIMKAIHFREACKANEDLDYSGFRTYSSMSLDRDMVKLKGELHLCSLGTVWTKKDGFLGSDHILLGTASCVAGKEEELQDKKIVSERELKAVAFDGLRP